MADVPIGYMKGLKLLNATLSDETKSLYKVLWDIQKTTKPSNAAGMAYFGKPEDIFTRKSDGSLVKAGDAYTGRPENESKKQAGGAYGGSFTAIANVITEDSKQVEEAVKEKGMTPMDTTVFNKNGLTEICKAYTNGTDLFLPIKSTNFDEDTGKVETIVELVQIDTQYGAVKRKLDKRGG